jgi:hypothetical protein
MLAGRPAGAVTYSVSGYNPEGDGAITGAIDLSVSGGMATDGTATLMGGMLSPSPASFSLVTSNCCGYPNNPPDSFTGWRAGDGTDWFGGNTNYPIDSNGLIFESGPWDTTGTYVFGVYSNGSGGYEAALFGPGGANNYYTYNDPITLSAVPEPSTWAMLGLGFAGLAFVGYRKRREALAIAA